VPFAAPGKPGLAMNAVTAASLRFKKQTLSALRTGFVGHLKPGAPG